MGKPKNDTILEGWESELRNVLDAMNQKKSSIDVDMKTLRIGYFYVANVWMRLSPHTQRLINTVGLGNLRKDSCSQNNLSIWFYWTFFGFWLDFYLTNSYTLFVERIKDYFRFSNQSNILDFKLQCNLSWGTQFRKELRFSIKIQSP